MELQPAICYQAVRSHDSRFDGLFFTCVLSTGIYCRPVCPAQVPKFEHCRFVSSIIEAEKAGFRPCLRCQPERAPSTCLESHNDSPAQALADYIDETLLMDEILAEVTKRYGVTERHMRRLFVATFGVEPKMYVTTRRLLFAKQLLQDTTMPILQVAYASGFGSLSRRTAQMQRHYHLTPLRLRKQKSDARKNDTTIVLRADYRPPFHWQEVIAFIAGRATPFEYVEDATYHRIVNGYEVLIHNNAEKSYLEISIPLELSKQTHDIMRRTRALFDLDANPTIIEEILCTDPVLKPLTKRFSGLRVPGCWDAFEMLVRVVVGQQVSVAGATTVMWRIIERIGITPEKIAASSPEEIASAGMPLRRAETIWTLGRQVASRELQLNERDPQLFSQHLRAIPGIGPWTTEYACMRILHWPNAFPAGDLGLQKAHTPGIHLAEKQLIEHAKKWQPWRSYGAMLLWVSLQS
jgi:AraC family transcriptional regulator of adaptative response / DNA-3-methyladenine glycosylase II